MAASQTATEETKATGNGDASPAQRSLRADGLTNGINGLMPHETIASTVNPRPIVGCPAIHAPFYPHCKRAIDVFAAAAGLLFLSPLMLTVATLIWLVDGGPIIFRQRRIGINGTEFTMLKFRSMVRDADAQIESLRDHNGHGDSITFKMSNDPRILPWIGHFIRRTSIDELPQLWNVIRGEMSLVGPRPALPREVATYQSVHLLRLAAKPGLTCFWQVSGRGDLDFETQCELDTMYVAECSPLLDLLLIAKTIPALVVARGAR